MISAGTCISYSGFSVPSTTTRIETGQDDYRNLCGCQASAFHPQQQGLKLISAAITSTVLLSFSVPSTTTRIETTYSSSGSRANVLLQRSIHNNKD